MLNPATPSDSSVKQSPWLVGQQRFSRIRDREHISRILKGARDNKLFMKIASPAGNKNLFFDSFLLEMDNELIRLYRSPSWPKVDQEDSFRVFFLNSKGCWHALEARPARQDSHSISVSMPKTLYVLRHRGHSRLVPPRGTKASFTYENQPFRDFQVVNISESGMLIRSCEEHFKLPISSRLKGICIDSPGLDNLPSIKQAQVVRHYRTSAKTRLCFGISFQTDCRAGEEIVRDISSVAGNC